MLSVDFDPEMAKGFAGFLVIMAVLFIGVWLGTRGGKR